MDEKIVTLHDFSSDFFGTTLKRRGNNFNNNNNAKHKKFFNMKSSLVGKTKVKNDE